MTEIFLGKAPQYIVDFFDKINQQKDDSGTSSKDEPGTSGKESIGATLTYAGPGYFTICNKDDTRISYGKIGDTTLGEDVASSVNVEPDKIYKAFLTDSTGTYSDFTITKTNNADSADTSTGMVQSTAYSDDNSIYIDYDSNGTATAVVDNYTYTIMGLASKKSQTT